MIEIEPENNVKQFITIHLNYHIFIFFAVVVIRDIFACQYLFYHYTYICVIKLFLRSILQMPFWKDNLIIDGSI